MNELSETWPPRDVEQVEACPYCGCQDRTLAYKDVQDWSFECAPGHWSYWDCADCKALYLSPRPTESSIGRAYKRYYTHTVSGRTRLLQTFKNRLRNEYWSHKYSTSFAPRLHFPAWSKRAVQFLERWITEPFGLSQLVQMRKGVLIDIGCGSGATLVMAQQLGWNVTGIELDAAAVESAKAQGLEVIHGGYDALAGFVGQADCVVCSHVIEHVHKPLVLLSMLQSALKPGGVALFAVPNATSYLRQHYAENWRGLEAPRHLAIPAAQWLLTWFESHGFSCAQFPSNDELVATESERIMRRGSCALRNDVLNAQALLAKLSKPSAYEYDMIQVVCTKNAA
jgi:2-polyprenyl-3-methyl-5-hydroxy-6-metoxy-1,4-benzoquinol methylase